MLPASDMASSATLRSPFTSSAGDAACRQYKPPDPLPVLSIPHPIGESAMGGFRTVRSGVAVGEKVTFVGLVPDTRWD